MAKDGVRQNKETQLNILNCKQLVEAGVTGLDIRRMEGKVRYNRPLFAMFRNNKAFVTGLVSSEVAIALKVIAHTAKDKPIPLLTQLPEMSDEVMEANTSSIVKAAAENVSTGTKTPAKGEGAKAAAAS